MILIDPRKSPSKTDPGAGAARTKALCERRHILPDGTVIGRDQELWNIGQNILRSEQAVAARLENRPSQPRRGLMAVVHSLILDPQAYLSDAIGPGSRTIRPSASPSFSPGTGSRSLPNWRRE